MNHDNTQTPISIPNSTAEYSDSLSITTNNYALANTTKQYWMHQKQRQIPSKFNNMGIAYVGPGNGSEDAVNRQQGDTGQNNITQAGVNNYNRSVDSPSMTIYADKQNARRKRPYEEQNNFTMPSESHPLKISNVGNNFPDMMHYNPPQPTTTMGGPIIVMKDQKFDPQQLESVFTGNILSNISNLANMPLMSNNIPAISNVPNVTNVPTLPDMSNITNAINNSLSSIPGMANVSAVIMMPVVLNMPNNVPPQNNLQYMQDGQGQYMSDMQRGYPQHMSREYMHNINNSSEYRQRMSSPYIQEIPRQYNMHDVPRTPFNHDVSRQYMTDYQRHFMPNNPSQPHAPLQHISNNQPVYSNMHSHPPPSFTPQYRPPLPYNTQTQFNTSNMGYPGYHLRMPQKPTSTTQNDYHYQNEQNQSQINTNPQSNPVMSQQHESVPNQNNVSQQQQQQQQQHNQQQPQQQQVQQQPKNVKSKTSNGDPSKQNKPAKENKRVAKPKKSVNKEVDPNQPPPEECFILPDAPPNSLPNDNSPKENDDLQLKIVKVESLKDLVDVPDSPPMQITEKITIPYNDQSMDNTYYLLPEELADNNSNKNNAKKIMKF